MLSVAVVMSVVAVTMFAEARISGAHERELRAAGAVEPSGDVYGVMRLLYPACFVVMATEALLQGTQAALVVPGMVIFALAKALKWWAIASLGDRWSFRVLVLPRVALVNTGPYRFLRHPNYLAVVGELVGAALMLGALWTGTLACIGFVALIRARIHVEERALGMGRSSFGILGPPPTLLKDVAHTTTESDRPLSVWARAADGLTLALLMTGVVVAVFGGFRIRVFTVRISLMSAWRVLLWAAAVMAVRHALVRHAPLYQRLIDWARTLSQSLAVRAAWPAVVGTRLPVLLVGYFAVVTIGYAVAHPPNRISDNEFLNLPSRWDTGWYVLIATNGYRWDPDLGPTTQQNIAFFPAYPMLMRVGGRLIGERPVLAGMLIALAAFFVALMYVYGLARQWLDHEQAVTAVWLLAAYPFAVFFSAAYTESLYLCGASAAFYHFHRGQFTKAGAWGALVGLTRPNGCLLSIPLALLAAAHVVHRLDESSGRRWLRMIQGEFAAAPDAGANAAAVLRTPARPAHRGRVVPALAAAAMPGLGMLVYSAFVYSLTGDPFSWARAHLAWGRQYSGLVSLFTGRYKYIANEGFYDYTASVPLDLLNAVPAVFALGMSWLVFKRFGLAYVSFLLLNLIPPMVAGGLLSVGRFTSVLFPAFLALALLVSVRARPAWIAAFAMGQALNASLFFTWRQLF